MEVYSLRYTIIFKYYVCVRKELNCDLPHLPNLPSYPIFDVSNYKGFFRLINCGLEVYYGYLIVNTCKGTIVKKNIVSMQYYVVLSRSNIIV